MVGYGMVSERAGGSRRWRRLGSYRTPGGGG